MNILLLHGGNLSFCVLFTVFAAADRGRSLSEKTAVQSSTVRGQI